MSVLIVAGGGSPEARRVAAALRRRRVRVTWLDTAAFPAGLHASMDAGQFRHGGKKSELPEAVYLRGTATHPLIPTFDDELEARPRGVIAQCDEKRAFLESILLDYARQGVRLVNSLEANAQHGQKPYQLRRLGAAGLPVPDWLATNDPAAVRRFARTRKAVVYKPLSGGAAVQRLTTDDLTDERLAALSAAPVLFQRLIVGVSLRVFVVGRRVVAAAAIHSDALDYRGHETAVEPVRLDPAERRAAITAARVCGMTFAGVDLIRGASDFVVLEVNPSPMFAVFEDRTGLDVHGPLAALLAGLQK